MTTTTRQLAAIMFTDMVGYTSLMQQNEQLAVQKKERFAKHLKKAGKLQTAFVKTFLKKAIPEPWL